MWPFCMVRLSKREIAAFLHSDSLSVFLLWFFKNKHSIVLIIRNKELVLECKYSCRILHCSNGWSRINRYILIIICSIVSKTGSYVCKQG